MIKGTGLFDGRPTVFLGLSRRNLEKFLAEMGDTYMLIKREEMGLTFDILIYSGETEEAMGDMLKAGITPDTIIHDRRRKP